MQVGNSNYSVALQLSRARQSSTEQTARQIQIVRDNVQAAKDQVLQSAVQQAASAAELKGRLVDVTV